MANNRIATFVRNGCSSEEEGEEEGGAQTAVRKSNTFRLKKKERLLFGMRALLKLLAMSVNACCGRAML